MTGNQFNAECDKRLIHPAIVLENDEVWQALADRDDARVLELLDSEF